MKRRIEFKSFTQFLYLAFMACAMAICFALASFALTPKASARNPEVSMPEPEPRVRINPPVTPFPYAGPVHRQDLFKIFRNLEDVSRVEDLSKCSNFVIFNLRERMGDSELQRQVFRDLERIFRQRQHTYTQEQFFHDRAIMVEFEREFTAEQRQKLFDELRKKYRTSVTLKKCEPPPDTVNRGTGSNQPPP
jgi:hypothetical protein